MGHHCCTKQKVKRGLWSPEEDEKLVRYITTHGHGCWSSVPKQAGLQRCGKSCRLRWINYLRPDLRRGSFSAHEERVIIDVHRILGNRWAQIAKHLPGRTDNEVKNFWNSCIKKKLIAQGLDPKTHNLMPSSRSSTTATNTTSSTNSNHLSQFQQTPTTPFTISTNMKNNSTEFSHPPILTMPPAKPTSHVTTPNPNLQYQDPSESDALVSFKDQNPSHLMMGTLTSNRSSSSSSLEHTLVSSTISRPGLLDESFTWDINATESLEIMKNNRVVQDQEDLMVCKLDFVGSGNEDQRCHDFDPFDSASFDLDLMESALMPCGGGFCNSDPMEQLQWDY